jgi:tetratricopeptide (TPR) repeat protein
MQQKSYTNRFMLLLCLALIISITLPSLSYANKTSTKILEKQQQTQQQIHDLTEYATQTSQQLKQLQNITQDIIDSNVQEDVFVTTFRILAGFTLILLLSTLYILTQKYAPLFEKYKVSIKQLKNQQEQHDVKIEKLKQQLQHEKTTTKIIQQHITEADTTTHHTTQQLQEHVQALQDAQQFTKDQVAIARDILQKHLKSPLEQGIPELDVTTLKLLLNEGQLDFQDSLKAKALIAEHQQKWPHALQLWDTLLLETGDNNEALLHIGYSHYKQAADNSKNQHHLDKAVNIYDRIMISAPEYFEDAYGYDDQTVGPEAINTNSEELWIYQQLEELIIKTDELRNYQSILNIACKYAAEGQLEDARDCLEQVSPVYHAASCKQLQKDTDLDAVRKLDWFQDIIKSACMVNQVQKAEVEQRFHKKI